MSSHVTETRNKILTAKLLKKGYRYHKLRKTFSKFYRRHHDLVSKFNTGLQGLSELEFYGDWVYKFRKNVGRNDFSDQKNIIIRYKRIGYNMNVTRQTACLVVNPIAHNNFASSSLKAQFFHYTLYGCGSLVNCSQKTVPRAIAHIKGLSYLRYYDVIMMMECLNRRGLTTENKLKLVKCSILL